MSGVVCVVCPFADDEKLKNIQCGSLSCHAPLDSVWCKTKDDETKDDALVST